MRLRKHIYRIWAGSIFLVPMIVQACPRCVEATPYKTGMFIAVLVLLPVPLVLGSVLYYWVQKAEKEA